MRTSKTKRGAGGFTVLELLIVLVALFILTVLLLPGSFFNKKHPPTALGANCVNNLKQVGLAFRIWSGDNGDMYPMRLLTNASGAQLYVDATNGFRYFQVMSNELSTPKIIVCPADFDRNPATNFTTDFNRSRVGYFVGLDADESQPRSFLAGDWNITNGLTPSNGILNLQSNQNINWTQALHTNQGNVTLGDGSVLRMGTGKLKDSVALTGSAQNRILLP